MSEFDFDQLTNRKSTRCYKWDGPENELPMWVADMDFETAPCITRAIHSRADHGIFGYDKIPEEWAASYIDWWKRRHDFEMKPEWLIFTTGVIPAVSTSVRRLTHPAENVLMLTPIYNTFFNSIVNNGRNPLQVPMNYADGIYTIDFEALEAAMALPQTTMMILCNPHNPIGRIWDRQTLAAIGELAAKHGVVVLSDEIHCDLADPGKGYIPYASVSETCRENCVVTIAPTKCFNIAGLQTAAVCVPNEILRNRISRGLNNDEVAEPNSFAVDAAIAAFREGEPWLDALNAYVFENKTCVRSFVAKELPQLTVIPGEATYLLWLDCSALPGDKTHLGSYLREHADVYFAEGNIYGNGGRDFLRINLATQKSRVEEGMRRLKKGIELWTAEQS